LVKKIFFIFTLSFLILISVLFLNSCCCFLGDALRNIDQSTGTTEVNIEPIELNADFEMSQNGQSWYYFEKETPVVFKSLNSSSYNPEKTKYKWSIDGKTDLEGSEVSYKFNDPGVHAITLTVSQNFSFASSTKNLYISYTTEGQFLIIKPHETNVGVKYVIENKGPGSITKIQCRIETPYNFSPVQTVLSCTPDNKNIKEIKDDAGNLIYRFKLNNLKAGLSTEVGVNSSVLINEFIIKKSSSIPGNYDADDNELEKYTKSEKYIDCDSNKIIDAANTITAGESDPYVKAELLYNFVRKQLSYDYDRMKQRNFKIADASEIINWDKGVCTDYSLLYAALCRAAGIPCKFVVGLSLKSVITEYNGSSDMSHAWNEIKLPGYGWVPVDITSEAPFLKANVNLNLKTFEGTGSLYPSIKIDNYPANALGFFYYYNDAKNKSEITTNCIYTVTGINPEDISIPLNYN